MKNEKGLKDLKGVSLWFNQIFQIVSKDEVNLFSTFQAADTGFISAHSKKNLVVVY